MSSIEGQGIRPANPAITEPGEATPLDHRPWLGGVFEIGGSVFFHILRKSYGAGIYCYPSLHYRDDKEARVSTITSSFRELLDPSVKLGYTKVKGKDHWRFQTTGSHVPPLVRSFAEYMPSRAIMVNAFQEWEQVDMARRAEIGQSMSGRTRSDVTVEQYRALLQNPNFLAGVIDCRGGWLPHPSEERDYISPLWIITSTNKSLLDALQIEFGGNVHPAVYAEKGLPDEEINSFSWIVENKKVLGQLVLASYNFLRFPDQVRFR